MLNINGKSFMNLQEAVQWLLDNNALPFQANVNYVANTEIAKSAIINPSPASIKVGALVLFADSKIGTVSGITSNGFMVGSDYTDIKLALNYITNVSVNASAHLIVSFSDGTQQDAGLIKEVSNFSIDGSQHLIANYNDGTSTDLGSIFGNISIDSSGNVIARTFDQTNANFSTNLNFTMNIAGLTLTNIYSVIKKINGVLHVIVQFSVQNTTASDITVYLLSTAYTLLPNEIGEKIVDLLGHTVDESVGSNTGIACTEAINTDAGIVGQFGTPAIITFFNANAGSAVGVRVQNGAGVVIPANTTRYFSGRIALTLV